MESAGARLKKVRLEKGLTLEEAKKKTKIPLNILRAIEEDSLVGVSPVYIKGYIKIYCDFLGVQQKEYLTDYKEPNQSVKLSALAKEQDRPIFLHKSGRNFFALFRRIKIKPLLIALAAIISSLLLFKLGKALVTGAHQRSLRRAQAIPVESLVSKIAKGHPAKTQKVLIPGAIRIGLRARETCYLSLKADGRLLFHGQLRKGSSESWQAKEKIEFSLNNAAAVDLQLNGNPMPKLGRKSEAIKAVVTREGGLEILH